MDTQKIPILISFLFTIATLFLSIGYASINSIALNINENIKIEEQEGIFISSCNISYDENNLNDDASHAMANKIDGTILTSTITLPEDNKDAFVT